MGQSSKFAGEALVTSGALCAINVTSHPHCYLRDHACMFFHVASIDISSDSASFTLCQWLCIPFNPPSEVPCDLGCRGHYHPHAHSGYMHEAVVGVCDTRRCMRSLFTVCVFIYHDDECREPVILKNCLPNVF